MKAFDIRLFLTEILNENARALVTGLKFLTTDQLAACPMGAARSPLHFTAECVGFNDFALNAFPGGQGVCPWYEEGEAFYEKFDRVEEVQAGLERSAKALIDALRDADDGILTLEVQAPWGETLPLYRLVHHTASHMSYHYGQINYVQSLYGDIKMHA